MTLTNYINDLLYRYDCVIVPDFGGFVTNAISAKVNHFSHTFYPPTKQITFNSHLKNNDGLLANYIASSQNVSFEKATNLISETVQNWKVALQSESVVVGKIGSLSLNKELQIVFEPNTASNYLTETFGMTAVSSPAVKRLEYNKQAGNLTPVIANKKTSNFLKYAATIAVLLTIGGTIGWNSYNERLQEESFAKQQQQVENKIQSATFVISNPLPTIQLNVEKEAPKNFHIIAGAFGIEKNALKKLTQLKAKGYNDAQIIGKNNYGLIQVTYSSFFTRREALKKLKEIRLNDSKDAWFLSKKIQ